MIGEQNILRVNYDKSMQHEEGSGLFGEKDKLATEKELRQINEMDTYALMDPRMMSR